jgi:hypothetical protein
MRNPSKTSRNDKSNFKATTIENGNEIEDAPALNHAFLSEVGTTLLARHEGSENFELGSIINKNSTDTAVLVRWTISNITEWLPRKADLFKFPRLKRERKETDHFINQYFENKRTKTIKKAKTVKSPNEFYPVSDANSIPAKFIAKLNFTFFDKEEKRNFKITNICTCSKYPECFFYEYYDYDQYFNLPISKRRYEYTPCYEMLSEKNTWIQWK